MRHKQKPDLDIKGILPPVISVFLFIVAFSIWGPYVAFNTLGSIILLYAIFIFIAYYRTKHIWTLVSVIYMLVFSATLYSLAPHLTVGYDPFLPPHVKILMALTVLLFWFLIYLNFTRKLKWRGRDILELAAYHVEQAEGSFTERPLPTCKVNFTKRQLDNFAHFFQKKLLGLAYWEESRVVFMPLKFKNEHLALYNPNYNYHEKTWVAINYNGNVSVNFSKKDYLEYWEDLAFDELCHALSDVIIDFLQLYIERKEVRIIDKLDSMRINVFT